MPTQAKGSVSRTVINREAVYGTADAAANRRPLVLPKASNSLQGSRSITQSAVLDGDRNPNSPSRGNMDVAGQITGPVDARVFPAMLRACIGAASREEVVLTANDKKTNTPTLTISSGAYTFSEDQTDAAVDVGARVVYRGSDGVQRVGIITAKTNDTTGTMKDALQSGSNPPDVTGATVEAIAENVANATPGTVTISSGTATFTNAPSRTLDANDMIVYGASNLVCKVTASTSSTVYSVVALDGIAPADAATQDVQFAGEASYWKQIHKIHATDELPSLSIEKGFTDLSTKRYEVYTGCKLNSLSIRIGGEGEVTYDAQVQGKEQLAASETAFDAGSSPSAANLYNLAFQQLEAAAKEGGSTIAYLETFNLNFGNNLDASKYVLGGGGKRRSLPEGTPNIGGSIDALFEDAAILTKAENGTQSSLDVTLTKGDESIRFYIPELMYEQASPEIAGPGGISINLNFQGYMSPTSTDASALVVEVVGPYAVAA